MTDGENVTTRETTRAYQWAIGILVILLMAMSGYLAGNYKAEAGMETYKTQVTTNTTEIKFTKETLIEMKQNQKDAFTALNNKVDKLLIRTTP